MIDSYFHLYNTIVIIGILFENTLFFINIYGHEHTVTMHFCDIPIFK